MNTYTLGVVGLGGIAHSFVESLDLPPVKILGCASRSVEKSQAFAKKYHLDKAYESYEEMLKDPELDIVYVAVPNKQHFDYAKNALLAGKHVLCEKAITTNLAELEELMAIAKEKKVILQEAMTIFHMPLFKKIQQMVKDHSFGKLQMIHAPFGSYMEPDPNNRYFNPDLGGGALLDIGTYAASFFRYFLEEQPSLIFTKMVPFETGVDEKSVSVFKTKQDQLITMNLSFQGRMPKVAILTFEKAYLTIPEYPRGVYANITYNDHHEEELKVGNGEKAFNYEVEDFIEAIETGVNQSLFYTHETIQLLDELMKDWKKQ